MKTYEIIEHTADIGIRVYGTSFRDLLIHAAMGMFHIITDGGVCAPSGKPENSAQIRIEAEDDQELFLAWLRELLFIFSTQKLIINEIKFTRLTPRALEAEVSGYRMDPDTEDCGCEIKAVTYHLFEMKGSDAGGWTAQVIFDI